ncbi:glycosyltransferase [Sphingomonas montana]|uniref:glycosyltransferase n=1 Tax=Sphingomonas montana TaxID=1843236 RepID=UPI0013E9A007|nr:glycosyltransferase [Sphingomonas montana]
MHEFGQGGTDRVCTHLARGCVDAGYAVELLVLFGRAPAAADMLALVGPDVTVRVLNQGRGSRHVGRLYVLRRFVARLRAVAPDVVVSTGNNMNWVTALAFRLARVDRSRLVLKITNPVLRPKDGPVRRLYRHMRYRRAFDKAAAILTLSDAETALLRRTFPGSAGRIQTVINPYVTPSMLSASDRGSGERDLILSIGRLAAQKRYDLLIRAFGEARIPGARLVILGEGPDRGALQALVRELDLAERVSLPGYQPQVEPWLRRARVFALSSRYEGLPAVVLEAMAANCPVVTTDCFLSARSLVGDAEGCAVVPDPIPSAFARAMESAWFQHPPSTLASVAGRYSIEKGAASHVASIGALLD